MQTIALCVYTLVELSLCDLVTGLPVTPVVEAQLQGTRLWGEVEVVTGIDKEAMTALARAATQQPRLLK
jgi:hypothetical protein